MATKNYKRRHNKKTVKRRRKTHKKRSVRGGVVMDDIQYLPKLAAVYGPAYISHNFNTVSNKGKKLVSDNFIYPIPTSIDCTKTKEQIDKQVGTFLTGLEKAYPDDTTIKSFYLKRCNILKNSLDTWKSMSEDKKNWICPDKTIRRVYQYLKKMKDVEMAKFAASGNDDDD